LELSLIFTPLFLLWPMTYLFPSLKNFWWKLLHSTFEVAGGCWIKLGQWISTRPDLYVFFLSSLTVSLITSSNCKNVVRFEL
jgi:hypothetical protein